MKHGKNCRVYKGAVLFPNVILGNNVTIFPGAVIGRPPLSSGATTLNVSWQRLPPVRIGDNCVVGANAVIYADVEIRNNSMVCATACIRERARIGYFSLISMGVTFNYNVKVGNYVKILDNSYLTGDMVVEDGVFIGMLVTSANDNAMDRYRRDSFKAPIVRKFATIGQGACLGEGVEIGENAIVGANSVVTKDVAPRIVVMGIPARYIRDLKPEELSRKESCSGKD